MTTVPFIRTDELSEKKFMPMHSSAVIRESMRLIILFVFLFLFFRALWIQPDFFWFFFLSSSVSLYFFVFFSSFSVFFFPFLHVQQVTKLAGNPLANLAALGLGGLTGTSGSGVNPSGMYHCT